MMHALGSGMEFKTLGKLLVCKETQKQLLHIWCLDRPDKSQQFLIHEIHVLIRTRKIIRRYVFALLRNAQSLDI